MNLIVPKTVSNELKLLISLLDYKLDATKNKLITEIASTEIDWERFIKLSKLHRVTTLVYLTISECGIAIPEEALTSIKNNFEKERRRNFLINSSLIQVNKKLEDNKLKLLWFKGPAQSQRMYKNPIIRSYSDIDLYIDLKDLHQVDELLRKLNFLPTIEWKKYPKSHLSKYVEIKKEFSYVHSETKTCIDLHWDLCASNLPQFLRHRNHIVCLYSCWE